MTLTTTRDLPIGSLWQGVNTGHTSWRVRITHTGALTISFECIGGAGTRIKSRKRMKVGRFVKAFVPITGGARY